MAIASNTRTTSHVLIITEVAVAMIVVAAAACTGEPSRVMPEEIPPPAFEPAAKCDVVALRSDLEHVKAGLTGLFQADSWQPVSIVADELSTGMLPGLILQLPSQPWTLFLPLGADWAIREVAQPLSAKLQTTTLAYKRHVSPHVHSEELTLWTAGASSLDYLRIDDRLNGKLIAGDPTLPELFKTTVLKSSLHLPNACDSDPKKLVALLKKYPSARAYAFRFYGTSNRLLPPSVLHAE